MLVELVARNFSDKRSPTLRSLACEWTTLSLRRGRRDFEVGDITCIMPIRGSKLTKPHELFDMVSIHSKTRCLMPFAIQHRLLLFTVSRVFTIVWIFTGFRLLLLTVYKTSEYSQDACCHQHYQKTIEKWKKWSCRPVWPLTIATADVHTIITVCSRRSLYRCKLSINSIIIFPFTR